MAYLLNKWAIYLSMCWLFLSELGITAHYLTMFVLLYLDLIMPVNKLYQFLKTKVVNSTLKITDRLPYYAAVLSYSPHYLITV